MNEITQEQRDEFCGYLAFKIYHRVSFENRASEEYLKNIWDNHNETRKAYWIEQGRYMLDELKLFFFPDIIAMIREYENMRRHF